MVSMRIQRFCKSHKLHKSISWLQLTGMAAVHIIAGILICVISLPVHSFAQENDGQVVRVGWFESTYSFKDQLGRRNGIAYEYQQKISAYTGWSYEYVEATWPELYQMLVNGEIDMLSDVSYTKERTESILYPSVPMGSESYYIFVRAGNMDMTPEDVSSFDGKVFGVDKGSIMETLTKEWAEKNGLNIEIRESTDLSVDETIDQLVRGEIDAYVTVDSYGDREECVPICQVGTSDYYFAVSKDRPDLLKELNIALTNIQNEDPYYNQRLSEEYIWSANANTYLSEKEIAWLKEHGKIKVGYRDNYMPFCSADGDRLTGALRDFLLKASDLIKNADIEFEPVAYASTEESLNAMEQGEVDVVFPVNLTPHDMEEMGIFSTEPFMRSEIFTVVKPGNPKDIFNDEDVTVVLLEGNINFDIFVKGYYPWWKIEHRPTLDECYKAVSQGEADCAMVNSYRITQNDRLRKRYKLSLLATGEDMSFAFGINRGNKELYAILNKIINVTEKTQVETNLSRYSGAREKVTFEDYLYDNAVSFIAIAAIMVSLILFLMLTKIRSDKKAEDRQKLITATELDPLTKLYARNYFFEYANRMRQEDPDYRLDAIVLDIEQFHIVNAIHGWEFGDKVLKVLGEEIKAYIDNHGGIACRSQADRFNIYCPHIDDYRGLYDRFQRALDNYTDNVIVRIRMGVMPYQPDLEPVELFDRARTACGMVRGVHHVRLMVFNDEMREREILEQRLLNDLRYALDNNEFLVYYQPKYDVQVNPPALKGAEALVRWKHHELGMIPPGKFISLFEKNGQIDKLDKYVWMEAARQTSEWKKKFGITIPISVNLSRMDIFDPNLMQFIDRIIEKNELNRADLHLEVTESAYTEDTEQILSVVRNLREAGYIIEMDDFGTGYSSLNMLSSMPVDILKLDKSFIDNIEKTGGQEEKDIRLAELILNIAKSLKLKVVAEGVENEKQLDFLKDRGCEMVQGYYFSPPLPAENFEALAFENK